MKTHSTTMVTSFSVLTSITTLLFNKFLCCILPTLLMTFGTGSVLANLMHIAPWLIALLKYKVITFIISGLFIIISGKLCFKVRYGCCETNRSQELMCRFNRGLYCVSVVTWMVGFFFAFVMH